jgi:hypothetical protein
LATRGQSAWRAYGKKKKVAAGAGTLTKKLAQTQGGLGKFQLQRGMVLSQFAFQIGVNGIQEFFGVLVVLAVVHFVAVDAYRQIFGHFAAFYGFNAHRFKRVGKVYQRLIVV